MDISGLSVKGLSEAIVSGRLRRDDVISYYAARIDRLNPRLNCFVDWDKKTFEASIQRQFTAQEEKLSKGESLPLFGVPMAIKDNICTKDFPTTAGSNMLRGYRPPFDATAVEMLKCHGAINFGKLNLDEFGMGSSNETSIYGCVRNPWDFHRVAGGSSGGAGSAVAAGLIPFAIASDTGGSIRQPAGFCGAVGFKPTYGLISRYGLIAYGSSLDQMGVIAQRAEDAHWVFLHMSGWDSKDSTSNRSFAYGQLPAETKCLEGKVFGVIREFENEKISQEVEFAFKKVQNSLVDLGAEIREVSVPSIPYSLAVYYILACAEASSNLARYDGIRYGCRAEMGEGSTLDDVLIESRTLGFGSEVRKRIILGTYVLSEGYKDAYYTKALQARQLIKHQYNLALEQVDFLIAPTSGTVAYPIGSLFQNNLSMYLSDAFTILSNLVYAPSISLRAGFSEKKLPIGFQMMGRSFDDYRLLNSAMCYESLTDESVTWPPL